MDPMRRIPDKSPRWLKIIQYGAILFVASIAIIAFVQNVF